jgi:dTDP-4-amino-4,6-dideoxygalactose transaminase
MVDHTGPQREIAPLKWPHWPIGTRSKQESVAFSISVGRWAVAGPFDRYPSHRQIFADEFAKFVGRKACILTSSGSSAIVIALQALGIGPGDRVLMPALTWVGCATAVLRVGAIPVFCHCEPDQFIGDYLTPDKGDIAAILAIHTYASRVNLATVQKTFPGVPIIEDFSHCHGASLGTHMAGKGGLISICSFQASKLLTSGEGGAVLTDDSELARILEALAQDSRVRNPQTGCLDDSGFIHGANYAMSELHAALASAHLSALPHELETRSQQLRLFIDCISGIPVEVALGPGTLNDGALYGLPIRIPGRIATEVAHTIKVRAGLLCDSIYPAIPCSPLFAPSTIPLYSRSGDYSRRQPSLPEDALRRSWILIPHYAFLASRNHIESLADSVAHATDSACKRRTNLPAIRNRKPRIGVVVLTRNRPRLLCEALASVASQSGQFELHLLLLNNGDNYDFENLIAMVGLKDVTYAAIRGDHLETLPPTSRVAHLRNAAVAMLDTEFVAFLDDDNVWHPNHLASLQSLITSDIESVHSWRTICNRDGAPTALSCFPWDTSPERQHSRFIDAVRAGIIIPSSAIIRDQVSAIVDDREVGMVDMGCWLLSRNLLEIFKFETRYTTEEISCRTGEDDCFLNAIRVNRVQVSCSQQPTLNYRLGGFSNS